MSSETNILQYLADQSQSLSNYMSKKSPETLWMVDIQRTYFNMIYEAQAKGIPLIMIGPNIPPELVYSFEAVPLLLDCLPTRLASEGDKISKYIDLADNVIPNTMCALNRTDVGLVLSGDLGTPDAIIISTTPCDSGRTAYSGISDYLGVPCFCIDTPFKQDDRGYTYIGEEIKKTVSFLEGVTGKKLDWNKMAEVIKYSNQAYDMLSKCADLRKLVPCPLPSRFLVLNEFFGAMVGRPEILDYLENEYKLGKAMADKGRGVVRGNENYRIVWLQNLPWYNVGILDWLEREYGAVVTMDAFGYLNSLQIEDPWNKEEVYKGLARRMLGTPMTHGSAGPVEGNLKIAEQGITEYKSNLAFFAGHVGCKHTWAVGKLIKDTIYEKYGIQTLTFDLDCVDSRYKSPEVVKETIREFMETIREN